MLLFIYVVSNNDQYSLLLIVIIKGYDFKEAILSSFDSTYAIYQAGKDVVDVKRRLWRLMIFIIFLSTTMLLFIYVVSNNDQYCLLLIAIIKGYDFKEAILSSLYIRYLSSREGCRGRETPIMKANDIYFFINNNVVVYLCR